MKNTKLRRTGLAGGTAVLALAAGSALAAAPANAAPAPTDVWDRVAQCESGGNWSTNTGNGYYGGLQFSKSTASAYGLSNPAGASKAQQKAAAKRVLKAQGPGAWPHCSKVAGLTRANGGAASASAATQQAPVQKKATTNYTTQKVQRTAKQTPVQQQRTVQQAPVQQAPVQQAPVQQQATAKHVAPAPAPAVQKTDAKGSGKFVTVKSGDTLAKIAQNNKVSNWIDLYSVNADEVSNPDLILVGQKLELPAK
ncbi:MAG: LysM peptidoglycan-binding domain-containing protein [Galactobacter sp.]